MLEDSPFNRDVSQALTDPDSDAILLWLENEGGWGGGNNFRIDFTLDVVDAAPEDSTIELTQNVGYYDNCDLSGEVPLPPGGTVAGNAGYQCSSGGDCQLLVHDVENELLYEAWDADVTNEVFTATCLVEWKLRGNYPPSGRGEGCSSADAGGFPIAPLLFDADEVAGGSIDHALRFVLPNDRIRQGYYLHPGSAYGGPSAASDSDAPIMGMRLRLKADFEVSGYSAAAQVVLQALKQYGMFLVDGGQIPLHARNDRGTVATWAGVGLGATDIVDLQPTDFEVLLGEGPDPLQGPFEGWPDCVKNTIPVPEPSHAPLAGTALVALAGIARARVCRRDRRVGADARS